MDVALVHWPAEAERRASLAAAGRPRLLLVTALAQPPATDDLLEEWVRLPADEADVRARVRSLARRAAEFAPREPSLDADGVLRNGSRSVVLSPLQARLLGLLLAHPGSVVGRPALAAAGWPGERPARNTVDAQLVRLRRKLAAAGLTVRTVRSRGYLLDFDCD